MHNTADLTLTPRAAQKVYTLMAEENNLDLKLRTFIQGGGCSGFEYHFTFEDDNKPDDLVLETTVPPLTEHTSDEESTYSAQNLGLPNDYQIPPQQVVTTLVDPISYAYLSGATIDYVIDTTGQHFAIINPHAKTTCGCGSSFSV